MKVTEEMIRAYAQTDTIDDGIQAVLDLIDPVPADVQMIEDADGDRWEQYGPTTWKMRRGHDFESIFDIVMQYGPITWEGKPSE